MGCKVKRVTADKRDFFFVWELRKNIGAEKVNDVLAQLHNRDGGNGVFFCGKIGEIAKPKSVREDTSMRLLYCMSGGNHFIRHQCHPFCAVFQYRRKNKRLCEKADLWNHAQIIGNQKIIADKCFTRHNGPVSQFPVARLYVWD